MYKRQAHTRADALLAEATAQTNELVNEHEIMQKAYAHANEVIEQAQAQAQAIIDSAVNDANKDVYKRQGLLSFEAINIRDYTLERHGKVDDYPYGGGAGMVMQAEDVYKRQPSGFFHNGKDGRLFYRFISGAGRSMYYLPK